MGQLVEQEGVVGLLELDVADLGLAAVLVLVGARRVVWVVLEYS